MRRDKLNIGRIGFQFNKLANIDFSEFFWIGLLAHNFCSADTDKTAFLCDNTGIFQALQTSQGVITCI